MLLLLVFNWEEYIKGYFKVYPFNLKDKTLLDIIFNELY